MGVLLAATLGGQAAPPESAFPGANGRIVFQRGASYDGGSSSLYLINANGSGLVRLTRGYQHDAQPSWSPNSELIAFESTRRGDTDVYVVRPDGSSLKEVTFSRGFDGDPAWNDDGSRLAFETTRNGPFDIYSVRSDGTDQVDTLNGFGGDDRLLGGAGNDALYGYEWWTRCSARWAAIRSTVAPVPTCSLERAVRTLWSALSAATTCRAGSAPMCWRTRRRA